MNLGSALLIVGSIYLHLVCHLDLTITILLVLLGIISWGFIGFTDERKALYKVQIRLAEAKARFYEQKVKA